jgi:hypothetical protein
MDYRAIVVRAIVEPQKLVTRRTTHATIHDPRWIEDRRQGGYEGVAKPN